MSKVYKIFTIEMNQMAILYQFGIFIGIFLISYIPYLAKKEKDPDLSWDHYYTINAVYSYIIALVAMFIVLKQNPLDPIIVDPMTAFGEGLILGVASTPTVKYLRKLFFPDED